MRFSLVPRDEKFFALFKEMSTKITLSAQKLYDLLFHFQDLNTKKNQIKQVEHEADEITHEIINKLNSSFVTPFDREDICQLTSALDDVVDLIDTSAQHLVIYSVDVVPKAAKDLGEIILKATKDVEMILKDFDNKTKLTDISPFCVEVNFLENEADRICQAAIGELFSQEKDPVRLIKFKEIYENLETITDKCEDVANILESIVVKNA